MLFHKYFAVFVLLGSAVLSGCSTGGWKTDYSDVNNPAISKNWRISNIDVRVPETLTVSEENTFAPNADIVWHGDPFGDRYQQVDNIITQAAKNASAEMRGSRRVNLVIEMQTFHALTDRTRYTLNDAGVHNISFTAQVFDAGTGDQLSPPDHIQADLIGYTGLQALAAEGRGLTQRVRIVDHVTKVIAGWLGQDVDVRGSFARSGR